MRGRCIFVMRRGCACAPAPATPERRCRGRPHALGASAGVRGYGAVGRAGGAAPTARSQAPPFRIGMGEAAETTGYGGPPAGDGGAGDASEIRCGSGTAGPATQYTVAGRRVRPRCAPATAGALPASRADEEQLSAAAEQVRERCARVGGGNRGGTGEAHNRQKGRSAPESDPLVGAHGHTAAGALSRSTTALRDGAAPRPALTARRVTPPPRTTPLPYHAYIPLSGGSHSPKCIRAPEYYRLANLFIWDLRLRLATTRTRTL